MTYDKDFKEVLWNVIR